MNRFKSLAAERGQKVQDGLGQLVKDYVERAELAATGLAHLCLFGSVARGDEIRIF